MAEYEELAGRLVGSEVRSFETFTGEDGREVTGGTIRIMFVSKGFNQPPSAIRFAVAQAGEFDTVRALGFGYAIKALVTLHAKPGGRIERRLAEWAPVADADGVVAPVKAGASNGSR